MMTTHARLTESQARRVAEARDFVAAMSDSREAIVAFQLAAYEAVRQYVPDPPASADRRRAMIREDPYPEAAGHAASVIRLLIKVIEDLTR